MSKKPATTPLTVRSSPFTGPTNSTTSESPVQSARRRLHYAQSQLPVRCSLKRSAPQLVNSLKKFPVVVTPKHNEVTGKSSPENTKKQSVGPSNGANTGSKQKKSLSMIDLSIARKRSSTGESAGLSCCNDGSSSARQNSASEGAGSTDALSSGTPTRWRTFQRQKDEAAQRKSQAAGLICRVLVEHAWRRRREEAAGLKAAAAEANQQLEHLQLQIVVLRKLLDKENLRVSNLAGELHRAKAQVDETVKERDQIKLEREAAQAEARREREITAEQSVTVENLRNELRSARDQVDTLDKQITRDREKLLRLREDKKTLLEKLSASEALAEERSARAAKAELSLEDTQMQLATQLAVTSSLQEELQRCSNLIKEKESQKSDLEDALSKLEKENIRLDERLRLSEETERTLSSRVAYLESQLFNQDAKMRCVEAAYNAQLMELNELRERFIQQSQEWGWSNRVLQLAGSVVRAPRVILRTLSFFSSIYTEMG